MKTKRKYLIIFVLIVIFILILSMSLFFYRDKEEEKSFDKEKYSQIYLYDLGSSNIEVIKKDEFVILINTGLEKDRDNLLDYLDQLGITEIDYLIITNRDDKYIGNASYIVKHFKVEYLYINDYEYTSDSVDNLFNELLDSYTEEIVLTSNETITLGDLVINIYAYLEDKFTMEDKSFIVNMLEGDNSIYLTYNASSRRLDFDNSSLIVSENDDLYDIKSKYYVYDGDKKIKDKDNLLKRNLIIYMNDKKLIVE